MTETPTEPPLTPATFDEVVATLSYALRYNERGKPLKLSTDETLATIVAEHLVRKLLASNFVIMQKPPSPNHSTG